MKYRSLFVIALIIIMYFKETYSVKCHQCRSDSSSGCEEMGKMAQSTECVEAGGLQASHCRKIYQITYFTPTRKYLTVRECGYHQMDMHVTTTNSVDYYMLVNACSKDGCNSARRGRVSNVWIVTFSIIFAIIFRT